MACVNAEKYETTDERIVPQLESEAGKLGLVVNNSLNLITIAVLTLHGRNVDGARQVIDNAVKEALYALFLEG